MPSARESRSGRRRDWPALATFVFLALLVALGATWDRLPLGRAEPPSTEPPSSEAPSTAPLPTEPPADFLLGGIQVHEESYERWFDRLAACGFNTVSVTDYAHHGDWDSYNLWFDGDNRGEVREIRAAKARGFQVVLILRVALDHAFPRNEFLWHGMIQPRTEEELEEWFYRYRSFARWWARTAEREGVDLLMIASEMNALTSTRPVAELPSLEEWYLNADKRQDRRRRLLAHADRIEERHLVPPLQKGYRELAGYLDARIATERRWAETVAPDLTEINRRRELLDRHWRELIAEVRRHYHGPLGYAANFDQYREVGFWDALDVLGVNAYFQLRRHLIPDAAPDDLYPLLIEGWRRVLGELRAFRERQGLTDLPVVFTELGYTDRANSTLEPWAADGFSLVPVAPLDEALAEARIRRRAQEARWRAILAAEERPAEESLPPLPAPPERPEELVIWQDQPERPRERALAVRALHQVAEELQEELQEGRPEETPQPFLRGLLYWKLSSHPWHHDDEPFVLLIDEATDDPLLPELQRFVR